MSPIVFILSSTYAASSQRSHKSRYQLQKDRFSESSHSQPYPGAYIERDESYHQPSLSYPPFLFPVSCVQEGIYSHYSVQGSWINLLGNLYREMYYKSREAIAMPRFLSLRHLLQTMPYASRPGRPHFLECGQRH